MAGKCSSTVDPEEGRKRSARMAALSCRLPWYRQTGKEGHQRSNSDTQLGRVLSGPMIRYGPRTLLLRRWDRNPIVCTVLPRP